VRSSRLGLAWGNGGGAECCPQVKRAQPARAQGRLALLEEQGMLADKVRERDELISGDLFPGMAEDKRDSYLSRLAVQITAGQQARRALCCPHGGRLSQMCDTMVPFDGLPAPDSQLDAWQR
jgi:hypothetical protein